MDVSNASGYDGATVAADACFIAKHATGRTRIVITEASNPQVRQVVKTYAPGFGLEVVEVPHDGGTTDPATLRRGGRRRRRASSSSSRTSSAASSRRPSSPPPRTTRGALPVAHVDPSRSACSRRPARTAARSRSARASAPGTSSRFGGPHYGFLAAREEFIRRMPGRIVGETVDIDGRARLSSSPCRRASSTSAARRPRRTSRRTRRCSRSAGSSPHVARAAGAARAGGDLHGARRRTRRSASRAAELAFPSGQRSRSLPCASDGRRASDARGARARRAPGLRARPRLRGHGRRPARRRHREADAGGRSTGSPRCSRRCAPDEADLREVAARPPRRPLPARRPRRCRRCRRSSRRASRRACPRSPEPELVRHFTELADRNFGVDTGFYPLGSAR